MKILLAAPQDRTVLGIIGVYCRMALERMGNEVSVFDFRLHPYLQAKCICSLKALLRRLMPRVPSLYDVPAIREAVDRKINSLLLERARSEGPDMLLVLCGENILADTIRQIRDEANAVTANWFHDSMLSASRQQLIHSAFSAYDYIFMVDSSGVLEHLGVRLNNTHTLPLACEPQIHRRMELSVEEIAQYGSNVAFVGTVTPKREEILEELAEFGLKIWGKWNGSSRRLKGCYQKQDIYMEEAVKIYNASRIVVDIHGLYGPGTPVFNVTPRVFEVPASGGFLLTNNIPQAAGFYEIGREMIVYDSTEELKRLIRYYLEHPEERAAIADKGYQRARKEHTYTHRLRQLLDTVNTGSRKAP